MADTVYFSADSLGRQVKDLLDREVKERCALLEAQLNADRTAADKVVGAAVGGTIEYTSGQALTDATAFDLCTIPVPVGAGVCVELDVSIWASDGTDFQICSEKVHIRAVNKAGTITAVVAEAVPDTSEAASSGTLTVAPAAAEGDANVLDISVVGTSSLTTTVFQVDWVARVIRGGALTKVNANA